MPAECLVEGDHGLVPHARKGRPMGYGHRQAGLYAIHLNLWEHNCSDFEQAMLAEMPSELMALAYGRHSVDGHAQSTFPHLKNCFNNVRGLVHQLLRVEEGLAVNCIAPGQDEMPHNNLVGRRTIAHMESDRIASWMIRMASNFPNWGIWTRVHTPCIALRSCGIGSQCLAIVWRPKKQEATHADSRVA